MPSSLNDIPVEKRKQLAATLGLFSVFFIAVGAVAATGPNTAVIRAFVVIALVVAVLLSLMAWGVIHSVDLDDDDVDLDAAIDAAITASPGGYGQFCDCGHEHDPTELHVTDEPCEQDGAGHDCTHSCATCVLTALRGDDSAARPLPGPRPERRPQPMR